MKNVTQSSSVPAIRSRVNNWPTGEPSTFTHADEMRALQRRLRIDVAQDVGDARVLPALEDEIAYRLRQHEHEHHRQDQREHAAKDEHSLPTVRGDQPRRSQTT